MTEPATPVVAGYVYVLHSAVTKQTKIGRSTYPGSRFADLRNHVPGLEYVRDIGTDSPKWLEKLLHDTFSDKREQGEWFSLTDGEIDLLRELPKYISEISHFTPAIRIRHATVWVANNTDEDDGTVESSIPAHIELVTAIAAILSGMDQGEYVSRLVMPQAVADCEKLLPTAPEGIQPMIRASLDNIASHWPPRRP